MSVQGKVLIQIVINNNKTGVTDILMPRLDYYFILQQFKG